MTAHPALLGELVDQVEMNLQNEQFGVEELAETVGMSRSNLHRKLQQLTGQSVSQFIREYRLGRAKELLQQENITASEVAHRVGFSSPTYFNKCYNEYFGFTPGETRNNVATSHDPPKEKNRQIIHTGAVVRKKRTILVTLFFTVGMIAGYWLINKDS